MAKLPWLKCFLCLGPAFTAILVSLCVCLGMSKRYRVGPKAETGKTLVRSGHTECCIVSKVWMTGDFGRSKPFLT